MRGVPELRVALLQKTISLNEDSIWTDNKNIRDGFISQQGFKRTKPEHVIKHSLHKPLLILFGMSRPQLFQQMHHATCALGNKLVAVHAIGSGEVKLTDKSCVQIPPKCGKGWIIHRTAGFNILHGAVVSMIGVVGGASTEALVGVLDHFDGNHRVELLVQVVVQVREDAGVPGGDLRGEGEEDQVRVVAVQVERSAEAGEAPVGRVTQRGGGRHGVLEPVRPGDVVDLAVRAEERVHLVVRDHRPPELALRAHGWPGPLPTNGAQQQEVGAAQPTGELFEDEA